MGTVGMGTVAGLGAGAGCVRLHSGSKPRADSLFALLVLLVPLVLLLLVASFCALPLGRRPVRTSALHQPARSAADGHRRTGACAISTGRTAVSANGVL